MICIANIVLFLLNGIKKSTYHSFFSAKLTHVTNVFIDFVADFDNNYLSSQRKFV